LSSLRRHAARVVPPLLVIVALVGLWYAAIAIFDWQPILVPSPTDVWNSFVERRDMLPHHVETTLFEALEGYGLAILLGVAIAVPIAYSRVVERSVYPVLVSLNAVPKVAIAPLLLLWFGFGAGPRVVLAMLICTFPIVLATATGLKSTPPEVVELGRSLSASQAQMFVKLRFPAAMPQIFVGLKLGISLAMIGAVVGEFVGGRPEGLGYLVQASGAAGDTALTFVAAILLALLSVILFYSIVGLERMLLPWARHQSS
jgi:NitT/TauT family transport system permease protein